MGGGNRKARIKLKPGQKETKKLVTQYGDALVCVRYRYDVETRTPMKTRLILKPGQKGTKRLTDKYGDALVCVRFRYDAESRQRLKTVELIVERAD